MRLPSVVLHPRSRRGLSSGAAVIHQLRQRAGSHLDLEQLDTKLFRAASSSLWVPPGGRGDERAAQPARGATHVACARGLVLVAPVWFARDDPQLARCARASALAESAHVHQG